MDKKLLRERWIDVLKGQASFLVVLGHAIIGLLDSGFQTKKSFEINIYKGIYIFHMPLFMAISGYVFAYAYLNTSNDSGSVNVQVSRVEQYKRQIYNLLAMYFIFSILMFGFKNMFNSYVNTSLGWLDLVKLPIRDMPGTPYWYLYILALSYLLAAILLGRNWNKKYILDVSFVVCVVYSILPIKEVITAQKIFYYFFFFMLGCSFELSKRFLFEKHYILQSILIVVFGWIILFQGNVLHRIIVNLLKIFVSILVINIMFRSAKKYMNHKGIFSFLGERSLEIYILHIYVTAGIRPVLRFLHINDAGIAVIITTFCGIVLPVICSYILRKMKLWKLFFKPVTCIFNFR